MHAGDNENDVASLAVLRVVAGLALVVLAIFLSFGLKPFDGYLGTSTHFAYRGLEWVKPLPPLGLRFVALVLGLSAGAMVIGWRTRITTKVAAVTTAYLFFLDCAYYESTAYLGVLLLAILAFAPSGRLLLVRFQVACVYVFSGISKWNADWLSGRTLRTMAPSHPVDPSVMAIGGMLFDIAIVPLLLVRRTRAIAFVALALFHVHNALVLELGAVPWLMLAASTVFLSPSWPRRLAPSLFRHCPAREVTRGGWRLPVALAWISVQLVVPLRRHVVQGDPYFTESGFHFTWALRSRQKSSVAELVAVDRKTGARERLPIARDIPAPQAARVAGDPYAIWQSAQRLAMNRDVEVHADAWVALNGASSVRLVDPNVDLTKVRYPLVGSPCWVRSSSRYPLPPCR